MSRLRVALDATPLIGERTGVGVFCDGALRSLAAREDVAVSAFAISWRRRHAILELAPPGVGTGQRPIPARPVHLAWRTLDVPPLDWFVPPSDVVHGTNFVVPPTRRAARVVTIHDLTMVRFPQMCTPATLSLLPLIRRSIGRGAFVHTPSEFVAAEVIEHFGADPARVVAVHHGVPTSDQAAGSGGSLRAPDSPFILAVGTIEPRKDYPGLVRAFDSVAELVPDVRLVICGAAGWGADAFEAAVRRAAHADRIDRLGYVTPGELGTLWSHASAYCFPSVYEGFGLPPLQAMAAGVPVVATSAGAVPEVVGDGAELVPPGDTEALAAALVRVLEDDDLRERLIAAGRTRAAGFTWDAAAEGLTALYRDALTAVTS
ncbi:MAG TPA: glycosyltransferase family 1 protein [Acidimicrobiales bacterium]|nr:glycosyltransferase family 1 protein [Acidimicrobiales bacterium]